MEIGNFPPTKKLYLEDSYKREHKTKVLGIIRSRGKRGYLVLESTIFHPLGSGQPSDKGIIKSNSISFKVKKVIKHGNVLLHWGVFNSKDIFLSGEEVSCILDWNRRYYIMKLHTAGHIMDYAVMKTYGRVIESISAFHGPPKAYLEYKIEEKPPISKIEEEINKVVKKNVKVVIKNVKKEELTKYLYNAPNMERIPFLKTYRVVEIVGINSMPCTGTHVRHTGEIEGVKVTSAEKTEKGWKIYYDIPTHTS